MKFAGALEPGQRFGWASMTPLVLASPPGSLADLPDCSGPVQQVQQSLKCADILGG